MGADQLLVRPRRHGAALNRGAIGRGATVLSGLVLATVWLTGCTATRLMRLDPPTEVAVANALVGRWLGEVHWPNDRWGPYRVLVIHSVTREDDQWRITAAYGTLAQYPYGIAAKLEVRRGTPTLRFVTGAQSDVTLSLVDDGHLEGLMTVRNGASQRPFVFRRSQRAALRLTTERGATLIARGEEGVFKFPADGRTGVFDIRVAPGIYQLTITKPGFVPWSESITLERRPEGTHRAVALVPLADPGGPETGRTSSWDRPSLTEPPMAAMSVVAANLAAASPPQDDFDVQRTRRQAQGGDGRAMAKLGFLYFTGRGGLPKNDDEAVRWFRRGADAGDGLAMAFLGASYWSGLATVPKDPTEAVAWFRRGADSGSGRAMALLGQAQMFGAGGLRADELEAIRWIRKGAETGDGRAMAMLGELYLYGGPALGRDEVAARRWISKGAEIGDGFAMAMLGRMYELGEGGLSRSDIEAAGWYRKGAAAGNGRAMVGLGKMCLDGRGNLPHDETEAVRWYREGADLLDPVAMFELGRAYEIGRGVPVDRLQAAQWYRQAASYGSLDAVERLAIVEDGSRR